MRIQNLAVLIQGLSLHIRIDLDEFRGKEFNLDSEAVHVLKIFTA